MTESTGVHSSLQITDSKGNGEHVLAEAARRASRYLDELVAGSRPEEIADTMPEAIGRWMLRYKAVKSILARLTSRGRMVRIRARNESSPP